MGRLTIGKIRGLQQISRKSGIFVMCAMDHRTGLVEMLEEAEHREPDYEEIVRLKIDMCSAIGPLASGILLDPQYGAAQCIAAGALPGRAGLLVSVEESGYEKDPRGRITTLLKGWSVEKIKRMGASAVKILVYYRPDIRELAKKQLKTIARVADDCLKYDIPFLVEPKTYRVQGETMDSAEFAARLPEWVIQTARDITALPIDVLKAEFPADMKYEKDEGKMLEYCRRLDFASQTPWVILSAGVDYESFKREVSIACKGGASGFLGGRAIWQEAMDISDRSKRLEFFKTVAADRITELSKLAEMNGRPWYDKMGLSAGSLTAADGDWYRRY